MEVLGPVQILLTPAEVALMISIPLPCQDSNVMVSNVSPTQRVFKVVSVSTMNNMCTLKYIIECIYYYCLAGDTTCDTNIDPDNENQYIVWAVGSLGETAFKHFLRAEGIPACMCKVV